MTKAPWIVRRNRKYCAIVSDVDGTYVSEALRNSDDANLVAAAPDLLASLKEIVEEWGFPNTPKWHRAKAAIMKSSSNVKEE